MNDNGTLGPAKYWCALLVNRDMGEKIKTDIIYSSNPDREVQNRNYKKMERIGRKPTSEEIWVLYMNIGPFKKEDLSQQFHEKWKKKTRGIPSRVEQGVALAVEHGLEVYVETSETERLKIAKIYAFYKKRKQSENPS